MKGKIFIKTALLSGMMLATFAHAQSMAEQALPMLKARETYDRQTELWSGTWITVPNLDPKQYSVTYYRKEVTLEQLPDKFLIHVTGDNRYKLYVNGTLVSVGPARGDFAHWKVSGLDLAPYLHTGKNVVAAMVCNYGSETPCAVFSLATGLLIEGEGEASVLNTDDSWLCIEDKAFGMLPVELPTFYVAGPGELVDMNQTIRGWRDEECDLTGWVKALPYDLATPHDTDYGTGNYTRLLVDNNLPEMRRQEQRFATLRRVEGSLTQKQLHLPKGWPQSSAAITIPAHSEISLLLDQEHLTNAYLNLSWSKGKDAHITTTYAEALYSDTLKLIKENRNTVEGLYLIGRHDQLISNGEEHQSYQTLEWRTFRYVGINFKTQDEPLILEDVSNTFTGYPFELKAHLDTDNAELQQMLEIGWRTQQLCAYETYMDCPYYEQLQYLGDTRIQALVTLYNTGDDTMVRNFLTQADQSRNAEGCAQGRYPTVVSQYITPYALSYVYAVHDYMMYGCDQQFVASLLPGVEAILSYFGRYQQADGRLRNLPGWNFSDWVYDNDGWQTGVAKRGADHCSALMDLQLLIALQMTTDIEAQLGHQERTNGYKAQADLLKRGIQEAYWDAERGLYADASDHRHYSQHTGSLALIAGMADGAQARSIAEKLLTDTSLAPCSVYYKYYLHEALIKAGLGDDYLSWLDIWRENIRYGLTTWSETSDITGTRSDCHAWGASPNIEFYRTILGIDSDAPSFARVRIEPHLSGLKADKKGMRRLAGTIPTPQGEVCAQYLLDKQGNLSAQITLPQCSTGTFVWKGQDYPLHEGINELSMKNKQL